MTPQNSVGKRPKAILLYSGGLDSSIVLYFLLSIGVDVVPVTFTTPFCNYDLNGDAYTSVVTNLKKLGLNARNLYLGNEYLGLLRSPKHGFGSAANPCIDCRILMLKRAKSVLEAERADFIATGEVMGQRPFSQSREKFELVDREAGVEGMVVRPLSGKLLPETIACKKGLIDKGDLFEIKGKTRTSQIQLARELNVETYAAPAGGCLLTEPAFGKRFKDLKKFKPDFLLEDVILLRFGRHFRIDEKNKIIVCRHQVENETIRNYLSEDDVLFEVLDNIGPLCVYFGDLTHDSMRKAASYAVSYSKAPKDRPSNVKFSNLSGTLMKILEASPMSIEEMHKKMV